ncbi:MAG: BMP family ABC transporter substrate-binding protein [Clostridia bacterium]|nr:BMP family ABC transporter substrate-binding protein [Clostridia bacterium]
MKRRLLLLLTVAVLFMAVGCSGRRADDKLKVGFLFQYGEQTVIGSKMLKAAVAACEEKNVDMEKKVGISSPAAYYDAAVELIQTKKCAIIFADSFADEQALLKAAKEFPEVEFCCAGGVLAQTAQLPNFHNAFAHIYQGRYLTGVVAGLKLNEMMAADESIEAGEAKLGYVAEQRNAENISAYTAFYLGARSVCPDVTMDVKFTDSRYDEQKEKEAAQALIEGGCVLLSQQSDSMGVPTVCENKGVFNVAYGGANAKECPETFLAACRMDWTPYFKYMIAQNKSDAAIATDWAGTLEDGAVALTELGKNVAQGTKEKLEATEKALMYGDFSVFDTEKFTVNDKKAESFAVGDTQVITNGIFEESMYRSAPYFTLEIDGIFLINEEKK